MTSSVDVFDVCVVGAGVEGSSTARYLASRGKKTLLLEQFPLPHSRGGSHGHSRIVRYGYPEAFFSALMPEAFQMWDEIEKKSGRALIRKCGLLTIDGPPFASVSKVISNVRHIGQECVQLTADEINRRFPGFAVSSDEYGALEPSSGLVQADLAIKTLQEQFVEFGGILHDSEKVLDIQPGSIVKIQTTKSFYKAKSVVITVGAWVNRVLKPLGLTIPLRIERISVCYWPVTEPHLYSPEKFPAFIFYAPLGRRDMHVYGLPVFEYPGLIKICAHKGTEISNPDCRDSHTKQDDVNIERVAEVIKTQIPGVKAEPSIVETCMYALTPDHLFVLDRHPEFHNIIIGVVSGHGFKMAPVVGKILSQMALGEKVLYDVLPFRLSRFIGSSGRKSSL